MTIRLLLLLIIIALPALALGQADKLTAEEVQAAKDIRERFITRLNNEARLEPLIPEMFVTDFGASYAKEMVADPSQGDLILLTSGLQFKKELLKAASPEDWQHARTAAFNFMHLVMVPMMNHTIPALQKGGEVEDQKLDQDLNNIIPKSVRDLFAADPVLANFIESKGDVVPITTVTDLRRVADTLDKGRDMVEANLSSKDRHLSAESLASLRKFVDEKHLGPSLEIADRETLGFPKGTRFIFLFATPMHALVITKVGADYKIVGAEISSPD
jgi:hypothetical protein